MPRYIAWGFFFIFLHRDLFYYYQGNRCCHVISRRMQAFYAIKCCVPREDKERYCNTSIPMKFPLEATYLNKACVLRL
jgi:hypothetical protein